MNLEAHCQITAPKPEVFKAFSDLPNLQKNVRAITNIEVLTPGEIGVGTKFKETRIMFGKEASEVMEITQFSPPDHLREEAQSSGMHYISDWTFSEENGQTTVTIHFSGKAQTFSAKIMGFIVCLMSRSMKKAFLADMEDLKETLEKSV